MTTLTKQQANHQTKHQANQQTNKQTTKQLWDIKLSRGSTNVVSRRMRAARVVIGSSPLADIKLPKPAPGICFMLCPSEDGKSYSVIDLGVKPELHIGGRWTTDEHYNSDTIPKVRYGEWSLEVNPVHERRSPTAFEPEKWVQQAKAFEPNLYCLWHLHQGFLMESVQFKSSALDLQSGFHVEFDLQNFKTATVARIDGTPQTLPIEAGRAGAWRVDLGHDVLIVTRVPVGQSLESTPKPVNTDADPRVKKAIIGMLAFWLLFLMGVKLMPQAPVEEVTLENLPDDVKKIIMEAPKSMGEKAVERGGGSGSNAMASPEVEMVKDKGALAALTKVEKSLGGSVLKALDMGSAVNSALSALDEGVKSGKIKTGEVAGHSNNTAAAVLGVVGKGAPGKGVALGIGGVGTKGIGGAGTGGGNGIGFGTGVGGGVGSGEGRNIAFGNNLTISKGGLERAEVEAVIQENIAQIRYCYNQGLRDNPNLEGKVTADFTIGSSGSVKTAMITQTTLREPAVESCIRSRIASWKFGAPRGGGEVRVAYPFLLRAN